MNLALSDFEPPPSSCGPRERGGPPRSAATREPGLILRSLGADVQAGAETEGQVDALSAILVPLLTAAACGSYRTGRS